MASNAKKTTMAKLAREAKLRERRLGKQARKDARKQASSLAPDTPPGGPGISADLNQAAGSSDTPPAVPPAMNDRREDATAQTNSRSTGQAARGSRARIPPSTPRTET
jgi:hypothetical protein